MPGLQVVGQLGVGGEGGGVQAGRRVVQLLDLADTGQSQAFLVLTGLKLAFEKCGQLRLHRGCRLGLANPIGRGVGPAGLFDP